MPDTMKGFNWRSLRTTNPMKTPVRTEAKLYREVIRVALVTVSSKLTTRTV